VGSEGWIHVGRQGYLEAHPADVLEQQADTPRPRYATTNHHQNWFACIRQRETPACDVAVGCRSTTVSHLGCIAHWTGRAQKWDPVAERFIGDDQANRLLRRAMREPWTI
jgi:hypothetical protein